MPSTNSGSSSEEVGSKADRSWCSSGSIGGSKKGERGKRSCGIRKGIAAKRGKEASWRTCKVA